MTQTSDTWKALFDNDLSAKHERLIINGVTYESSALFSGDIMGELMADPEDVGNAVARELNFSVLPQGPIASAARVEYWVQLYSQDGASTASEWHQKGVFYFSVRRVNKETGVMTVQAFDKMLMAERPFLQQEDVGEWPREDMDVINTIAAHLDIELDESVVNTITKKYSIPYPGNREDGLTDRQILSRIATMYCGYFCISDTEKLKFVSFVPESREPSTFVGPHITRNVNKVLTDQDLQPYTDVDIVVDSNTVYSATNGTGLGRILTVQCEWGTRQMANDICDIVRGYAYYPYSATKARVDPAIELGDSVDILGTISIAASLHIKLGAAFLYDVAVPASDDVEYEYPYTGAMQRELLQTVHLGQRYFGVRVSRQKGIEITRFESDDTEATRAVFNSDTLEFYDNSGNKVLWFDPISNKYYFMGDVNVSGTIVTETLYTVFGDMAHLTVDRLKTSRRIPLYLARNTSDDNYIDIVGESFEMIAGEYAGGTEQATNPNGELIYWESDPEGVGVTIGADGYPYLDGNRILTTTEPTLYPVTVYTYTDTVKARWAFQQDENGVYQPVLTMGAGDGAGANYATMLKGTAGLDLIFRAMGGKELGLKAGYTEGSGAGYLDLYGLRKTTRMDFSNWDNGTFTETIDGGITEQYRVAFDAQGRPASITDSTGHITEVIW